MRSVAKLSYGILCAAAAVLAGTGIGVFAFGRPPMTHWVLMAHIAAAPLFALGLVTVALTRAGHSRKDAASVLLWLVLVCGLVVILSGVLPMTPLFGTDGERALYLTHRYVAIVLAFALLLHWLANGRAERVRNSQSPGEERKPQLIS